MSAHDIELKIAGVSKQKANTRDLIFDCRKLIAYASEAYTLEPGDVMDCCIDRIGRM